MSGFGTSGIAFDWVHAFGEDGYSTAVATGLDDTSAAVCQMGDVLESGIVELRRYFHAHPELSRQETATSDLICAWLDDLGVEYRRVQGPCDPQVTRGHDQHIGTGIIATIRGCAPGAYDADGNPARRIALRTDMDALPVVERTGVPYVSQNPGVMHACGHDCHMAMMMGAVRMLLELRERLRGEVRVLFQPAEEVSSGALDMIAAEALEGVDAVYGAHVWSEVDAGTISCALGPRMANTDWFRIDIEGVSAHGSMPHLGVDAIVVACEIVETLQSIVSRRASPFEPVVLTVGEIHGGTARNIMAGQAYLTGTIRTWHTDVRNRIRLRIQSMTEKVAAAFGAKVTVSFEEGNPAVVNDAELAEVARQAVVEVLGEDAVSDYEGTMAGEDFAEYQQRVPGVFVFVGGRNEQLGCDHPQHSCYYNVDESALVKGSMVTAQWACRMLE